MSNANYGRVKSKPAGDGRGLTGQKQQTNGPGNEEGSQSDVHGGKQGVGRDSRANSQSSANAANGRVAANGENATGGNRRSSKNGQNRDNKSGKNSPKSGRNSSESAKVSSKPKSTSVGGSKSSGKSNTQKSGGASETDTSGTGGRNTGGAEPTPSTANRGSGSRASTATNSKTNYSTAAGNDGRDSKTNDGTADGDNSGPTSRTATGYGLQRNLNRGRASVGTASKGKGATNGNVRSSYHSNAGPYGENIERVVESPRPSDPPRNMRKVPSKSRNDAAKATSQPTTPTPPENARSRAGSRMSEDDGEKEPCHKCGANHHLTQSETCEHKICTLCLPRDVESIMVETDCPVCQRMFLYADAPGFSDQPSLNRFHLIKGIYDSIRPPSCQRCEETSQKGDEATCACRDCALYLCEPCADAHNFENIADGKGWKNHHIFLLEELKEQGEMPPVKTAPYSAEELHCPSHEGASAMCYCQTCRTAHCGDCRKEHKAEKHDFLDEVETKVYLKDIIDKEYKSTSYDVRAFDQFSAALRMKRSRAEKELKQQKLEVMAKFTELIRAIERKRDGILDQLDAHASDASRASDNIHAAITDERRYADAMKKMMAVLESDDGVDVRDSDEPDYRLLRIGEFVDQNKAALQETNISRDLVADVNNYCKSQHDVKILMRKREAIFELIEDHAYVETVKDYWLNDEALLAKQHMRHSVDNSICHVGAFRETGLPYYQFLWRITEKYREYYGKETFVLHGNTLQVEESTTPDLIQGDIFKSNQFQVFVKAGTQRLEKTELELFRNTEYSRFVSTGTGNQPLTGLVAFHRNGSEKIMSMVSGSKVVVVKDDRVIGRPPIGKGTKVAAVDKSGNLLIPFLIGKAVIRSQSHDNEEAIHLGSEEHAVMYTFDKDREYLWAVDVAENVVKLYDYRKLAFLYGVQSVHD